ncbi:MAG: hypothetical protein IJV96_07565 [Clostridia bacterium]|nr:hypothetical protein [Clostridia bacterium]
MKDDKIPAGEIAPRSPFLKKLDNFFYHYKWHTVVAVFLAVVILVVSLQTCSREPYDIEIMYAGPYNLNDRQTVLDIERAFEPAVLDKNEDGSQDVRLVSYWINEKLYSGEEGESLTDVAYLVNTSVSNEKSFQSEITAGNLSICLLSPYLFKKVDAEAGFMRVTDLAPILKEQEDVLCVRNDDGTINRFGILLSETALGQLPGLSSLPKDTVICIRKKAYNLLNASRAEEQHEHAVKVFCEILSSGKKGE